MMGGWGGVQGVGLVQVVTRSDLISSPNRQNPLPLVLDKNELVALSEPCNLLCVHQGPFSAIEGLLGLKSRPKGSLQNPFLLPLLYSEV